MNEDRSFRLENNGGFFFSFAVAVVDSLIILTCKGQQIQI